MKTAINPRSTFDHVLSDCFSTSYSPTIFSFSETTFQSQLRLSRPMELRSSRMSDRLTYPFSSSASISSYSCFSCLGGCGMRMTLVLTLFSHFLRPCLQRQSSRSACSRQDSIFLATRLACCCTVVILFITLELLVFCMQTGTSLVIVSHSFRQSSAISSFSYSLLSLMTVISLLSLLSLSY